MMHLYRDDDWASFTSAAPDFIVVRDHLIPFIVFDNEDDVTTRGGAELGVRLSDSLKYLWSLRQQARGSA
jgi:hypothetical protein